MLDWSIEKLVLQLKYTWKIARNASDEKVNFIITVTDGQYSGRGEAAPNIRYNETPEIIETQFQQFLNEGADPDTTPIKGALRFAIESAYTHYICAKNKETVQQHFNLQKVDTIPISYSIPIMEIGKMKAFYEEQKLNRFKYIKIKVNAEEGFDAVKYLSSFCSSPLLVDANEAFKDVEQCIYFIEKLKKFPVEFLEQPLPSDMIEESLYLKKYSKLPLFADESVIDDADFSYLKHAFDGVNVKLMKAGGYINSIRLLKEAKEAGLKTMIGCMVETSLGISSGLNLGSLANYADLDSFLAVKNEPFNLLKEENGLISYSKNR